MAGIRDVMGAIKGRRGLHIPELEFGGNAKGNVRWAVSGCKAELYIFNVLS